MRLGQIANLTKAFAAFAVIGLATACADTSVAPSGQAVTVKAPAGYDEIVGVQRFTVSATESSVQRLGDHLIYFPAGSVCDPAVSSYGPTEWDKPCTPMRGSITITATMMRDNENRPYVDFQPSLRFVPTKEVVLFLRNGRTREPQQIKLEWCNNLGNCADESIEDASLKPFRINKTSIVGRRIKHFTGYAVSVGEPCPGVLTEDPDGTWMCEAEGSMRRSGYMVASGKDIKDIAKEAEKKKEDQ